MAHVWPLKFSSMWDRIFETPVPIDSLARIVISSEPWWAKSNKPISPEPSCPEQINRPIDHDVDLTRAPPDGLVDYRGRRGLYNIVIGFSHRKIKSVRNSAVDLIKRNDFAGIKTYHAPTRHFDRSSTWFVLRMDGQLSLVNNEGMRAKLKRLDERYIEDIDTGWAEWKVSPEWETHANIPAWAKPCTRN